MAITKEQIIALIDAKIAGQGSAVDIGGALPAILKGITDLIPESGGGGGGAGTYAEVYQILDPHYTYDSEALESNGYTPEVIAGIRSGEIVGIKVNDTIPSYYPFVFRSYSEAFDDIPAQTVFGIIVGWHTRIITITYEGTAKDLNGDEYASVYGIPNPEWSFSDFEDNGFSEDVVKDIFNGAVQGFELTQPKRHFKIISAEYRYTAYTFRFYYNQAIVVATVDFDYETATVTTEQSGGGGGSAGSLCYSIGAIPVSGTSQEIEEVFGQIFTDFIDSDYADESYPKFILCEDIDENDKSLIPFQISADIDGYGVPVPGTIAFVYRGRNYRVIRDVNDEAEVSYRIVSSAAPGYVGPIALEEEPNADWANITTVAGLTAVGITDSEVAQASRGFRTGITFVDNADANTFIPIESAYRDEEGSFGLSFRLAASRYSISYDAGLDEVTVSITTV